MALLVSWFVLFLLGTVVQIFREADRIPFPAESMRIWRYCVLAYSARLNKLFLTLRLLSVGRVMRVSEKMKRMRRGVRFWRTSSIQILRHPPSIQHGRRQDRPALLQATMTASTTPPYSWRRPRGTRNKPFHRRQPP